MTEWVTFGKKKKFHRFFSFYMSYGWCLLSDTESKMGCRTLPLFPPSHPVNFQPIITQKNFAHPLGIWTGPPCGPRSGLIVGRANKRGTENNCKSVALFTPLFRKPSQVEGCSMCNLYLVTGQVMIKLPLLGLEITLMLGRKAWYVTVSSEGGKPLWLEVHTGIHFITQSESNTCMLLPVLSQVSGTHSLLYSLLAWLGLLFCVCVCGCGWVDVGVLFSV